MVILLVLMFIVCSSSDLESQAIKSIHKTSHLKTQELSLLCVLFTRSMILLPTSIDNIRVMSHRCHFAVVSYTCDIGSYRDVHQTFWSSGASVVLIRCIDLIKEDHPHVTMIFDRLLSISSNYGRIWFLNENISLSHFDCDTFLHAVDCADWHGPHPSIVQPLLSGTSSPYKFSHIDSWNHNILAVSTSYIDHFAPMYNATFFDWFVRNLVVPLSMNSSMAHVKGGFDSLACRAAEMFVMKTMGLDDDVEVVACAVIHTSTAVNGSNMIFDSSEKGYIATTNRFKYLQQFFPSFVRWDFQREGTAFVSPSFADGTLISTMADNCTTRMYSIFAKSQLHHLVPDRDVFKTSKLRSNVTTPSSIPEAVTKVYAFYFPQFHRDSLNDKLWGVGFTDWDSLMSAPSVNRFGHALLAPGELGYYDLMDTGTRAEQAKLAKKYGIDGFIYHHYWFYDARLQHKATLARPLEALLLDGEPDLSFALHWCNQEWTATWQGKTRATVSASNVSASNGGKRLQAQYHPSGDDPFVVEHYRFLRKFFHHRNYIRVHGVPLFLVYRGRNKWCWGIINKLRALAVADGFPHPGLHIPQTLIPQTHVSDHKKNLSRHRSKATASMPSNKLFASNTTSNSTRVAVPVPVGPAVIEFDADFYYPVHNNRHKAVPKMCAIGVLGNASRPFYLGTITLFDNTPRRHFHSADIWNRRGPGLGAGGVVAAFERDLVDAMAFEACCQAAEVRDKGGKFVVVNAWNEWGEGMVLEPSDVFGHAFLRAVSRAKRTATAAVRAAAETNRCPGMGN